MVEEQDLAWLGSDSGSLGRKVLGLEGTGMVGGLASVSVRTRDPKWEVIYGRIVSKLL
jgi:hypothetical protein